MRLITILGGTGVFGRRIAADLVACPDTMVRIVGRHEAAGEESALKTGAAFHRGDIGNAADLKRAIDGSAIVIHAAGPFQVRDYSVAEACIDAGCHYLDLADARRFVIDISALDEMAKQRGVFIASGASSVPAITHAMIQSLQPQFRAIDEIRIALTPGNQNPRGASTIGAILTYVGRPIELWIDGRWMKRQGWGDARWLEFAPPVGRRRVHNCDVPDLELFPSIFGAKTVRFQAGVELNVINYTLSMIAALRRIVPMRGLHNAAGLFLRGTLMLYRFGSKNGSLSIWMRGVDLEGRHIERRIAIVTDDDGPATPCSPSIVLAKKVLKEGPAGAGAFPCLGFIQIDEIESHLKRFGVWIARGDESGWYSGACLAASGGCIMEPCDSRAHWL